MSAEFGFRNISMPSIAATVWPTSAFSVAHIESLPVRTLVVSTAGTTAAMEKARTAIELALPGVSRPSTIGEERAQDTRLLTQYQQLAKVVTVVSLCIAGCSLAVSVAAGLNDRKRPFSMLRLTGAPLGVLRRVVALETAVPLLVVSVVASATGFLTAYLFLRSQLGYSLQAPGLDYYLIVLVGIAASLGVIGSTLPLLRRLTGPEAARND
jgi:predicted lysophospholipase L1 biosynthesis ABC-type transport system permease subunit